MRLASTGSGRGQRDWRQSGVRDSLLAARDGRIVVVLLVGRNGFELVVGIAAAPAICGARPTMWTHDLRSRRTSSSCFQNWLCSILSVFLLARVVQVWCERRSGRSRGRVAKVEQGDREGWTAGADCSRAGNGRSTVGEWCESGGTGEEKSRYGASWTRARANSSRNAGWSQKQRVGESKGGTSSERDWPSNEAHDDVHFPAYPCVRLYCKKPTLSPSPTSGRDGVPLHLTYSQPIQDP